MTYLLPAGTPTLLFTNGITEIRVFRGESEGGETYEAFVGIGPVPTSVAGGSQ